MNFFSMLIFQVEEDSWRELLNVLLLKFINIRLFVCESTMRNDKVCNLILLLAIIKTDLVHSLMVGDYSVIYIQLTLWECLKHFIPIFITAFVNNAYSLRKVALQALFHFREVGIMFCEFYVVNEWIFCVASIS